MTRCTHHRRSAGPGAPRDSVTRLPEPEDADIGGVPDLLRMWQLSDLAACRHARHCRLDDDDCVAVKAIHMPPPLRSWFLAMMKFRADGKDFVTAYQEARPLVSAAIGWRAALRAAQACATRRRRPADRSA